MIAVLTYFRGPSAHWRRTAQVLSVAAIIFAVPAFAGLGLSLPLPASVERIAANLVPFANTAAVDAREARPSHGTIVRSRAERRLQSHAQLVAAPSTRFRRHSSARRGHSVTLRAVVSARPRHEPAEAAERNAPDVNAASAVGVNAPVDTGGKSAPPTQPTAEPSSGPSATPAASAPTQAAPTVTVPSVPVTAPTTSQPTATVPVSTPTVTTPITSGNGNGSSNPNAGGANAGGSSHAQGPGAGNGQGSAGSPGGNGKGGSGAPKSP